MATDGNNPEWNTVIFSFFSISLTTAAWVQRDPLPEVVEIAINGTEFVGFTDIFNGLLYFFVTSSQLISES